VGKVKFKRDEVGWGWREGGGCVVSEMFMWVVLWEGGGEGGGGGACGGVVR